MINRVSRVLRAEEYTSSKTRLVIAMLCAMLCLYSRDSQSFHDPQFWAEDGREFFVGQKLYGIDAFLIPYAGYLHLIPRLIAFLTSWSSAVSTPALYQCASVLVVAWTAATIATTRLPFAWVLGAMLIVPPHSGEVFDTITNLQWLMATALMAIIASPSPASAASKINQRLFGVASAFSGPFSVVALPLVLWRLWHERAERQAWWICGIVVFGAMVQLTFVWRSQGPHLPSTAPLYLFKVVGDRWIGQLAHGGRTTTLTLRAATGLIVAGVLPVLMLRDRTLLKCLTFSLILLFVVWYKFLPEPRDSFDDIAGWDRYFYGPRLAVLWILVVVVLQVRWFSVIAAAALVMIVVNYASWQRPILEVLPWRSQAWRIDQGEVVRIIINPVTASDDNAWTVTLPERP